MVDRERIKEELRVLELKDEKLLSKRMFQRLENRLTYLEGCRMGLLPRLLSAGEQTEMKHLNEYFRLFKEYFPELHRKWQAAKN